MLSRTENRRTITTNAYPAMKQSKAFKKARPLYSYPFLFTFNRCVFIKAVQ